MSGKETRCKILRSLRESKGLKQSDLAELLGLSQQGYQRYESGVAEPSMDGLAALADFYGVTTDYLLGREPQKDPFAELSLCAEDEQAVIDKYMSLPPEIRAMLLDVMRQLAGATSTPAE